MNRAEFVRWINALAFGKRLPTAVYIHRPQDWRIISPELAATVERAMNAARPDPEWNLLKLHTDQVAITFLTYPEFDSVPHPALAEATKINLNTGAVVRMDYSKRANPPILHRKETFLPEDDPRSARFAQLTRQEEDVGLYRDPSRIGLRIPWQTLLKRLGLSYDGHLLVKASDEISREHSSEEQSTSPVIERHRTAIKRYDLSRPVKIALDRGVLLKKHTFFDYCCGHGMDIEALSSLGFQAAGWDPAFRPDVAKQEADVVNIGYGLNVIEEPSERIAALQGSFSLTKRALIVSTLVAGQETDAHSRPYRDGFMGTLKKPISLRFMYDQAN
ncbi:MAG: DNA phosphorothioation-associated putative methyltransferase [Terrimicrobiaceae bacterium]